MDNEFYQIKVQNMAGEEVALSEYKDKVILIVNVASKCGFTPQYAGLEALWREYQARGLVILGFPCNQFHAQEPGDEEEIARFCANTYDVTFDLFQKVEVNGAKAHPLFQYLKPILPGLLGTKNIKWNFTKFLIDRTGRPVKRFAPQDKPESLKKDIEALL